MKDIIEEMRNEYKKYTSNAWCQWYNLRSLSLANVRASGYPEIVSVLFVQFGSFVSQLVGQYFLASRFLSVFCLGVNRVLGDNSIGLAWWAPRDEDRFRRHNQGFDRNGCFRGYNGKLIINKFVDHLKNIHGNYHVPSCSVWQWIGADFTPSPPEVKARTCIL